MKYPQKYKSEENSCNEFRFFMHFNEINFPLSKKNSCKIYFYVLLASMKSNITYYKHKKIDKSKWDECIKNSSNHLIYGLSWYLDSVCPNWHALIMGDYEAVMPLPVKKKYGISIIYHPYFAQQLGIFSTFSLHNSNINAFFKAIPKRYQIIQQKINAKNDLYPLKTRFDIKEMPTLLVNLYRPYETLSREFSSNTIRNIKKAEKNCLRLKFDTNIADFLLLKTNYSEHINEETQRNLEKILNATKEHGVGECIGVYHDNRLIAGAFIVRSFNRFIYLVSASNDEGKEKRAMFFLVNEFFKTHCEQKRSFDFEGSVIPGVANFFMGFGAKPEYYNYISYNRITKMLNFIFRLRFTND